MGKLGWNSGYIGSDQRTTTSGSVGYGKYYLERLNGRFNPVLGGIVLQDLLFYVTTKDSNSYPGSGVTWYDLSSNALNVTLTNGPTYISGVTSSIVFDGTNDYATYTGNTSSLNTVTNQVTLAALWKPNGFNAWSGIVGRGSAGPSGIGTWVLQNHNTVTGKLMFAYNASSPPGWNINTVSGSTVYTTGQWYYTVVTYDGLDVKFYVNGSLTDTKTIGSITFLTSGSLELGHDPPGGDEFLNGAIASAQVYSRALSIDEINTNFTFLKPGYL